SFGGDIGECTVTVVVKELVAPVAGHVDVEEAIVVVVAHRHASGEHSGPGHARFGGSVHKPAVTEITVEHVSGRRLSRCQVRSVRKEWIQPAVVVVIEPGDPGPESLEHMLFTRRAVLVPEGDTGFDTNVGELNAGLRGSAVGCGDQHERQTGEENEGELL